MSKTNKNSSDDLEPEDELPALPCGMSYGWMLPEEEVVEDVLWLRWPLQDILRVRILSDQAVRYEGHWYPTSRTYRLCTRPRELRLPNLCPFCPRPATRGRPIAGAAVWRQFLVVELLSGQRRIWEFGEAVAGQLARLTRFQAEGNPPRDPKGFRIPSGRDTRALTVRGLCITLHRESPRANGAVIVSLDQGPDLRGDLPPPMDSAGYVGETWRRAEIKDSKISPTLPFR